MKKRILLIFVAFFMLLGCGEGGDFVGPSDLSSNARTVQDYLEGKEIPSEKAWWLYKPDSLLLIKRVAIELKLEEGNNLYEKLMHSFVLVYKSKDNK
ncbi:MAG: hypothetical protein PF549_00530 [Patescibacteria group bacterium]|jgi:hypothetical protein|nr:hypothetical protein [Patescibacteria group bacterium]